MNKQVKININNKDYYCDIEVLKLIERLQDKVELLEDNRDEAIELIEQDYFEDGSGVYIEQVLSILKGEE